MPDPTTSRDIGRHDAQIETLQAEVVLIRKDLDEIKKLLNESRGGWRVMMAVAGLSGAVGAGGTKLLGWLVSPT